MDSKFYTNILEEQTLCHASNKKTTDPMERNQLKENRKCFYDGQYSDPHSRHSLFERIQQFQTIKLRSARLDYILVNQLKTHLNLSS